MKYLRFLQNGNIRYGLLEKGNTIREVVMYFLCQK